MPQYNIAPTDLTFLLESCPACFWRKVKLKKPRPYTPFPSVFSAIDKAMRTAYSGCSTKLVDESLPEGRLDTTDRKIKSSPISVPGRESTIVFSGKVDAIASFTDGTSGVLDFKTSNPKESSVSLYSRQLHCYRTILENPEKASPVVVSYLGIVCESPDALVLRPGAFDSFSMKKTYVSIEIDDAGWGVFLLSVLDLLDGEEPVSTDCHYCDACRWRQLQAIGATVDLGVQDAS